MNEYVNAWIVSFFIQTTEQRRQSTVHKSQNLSHNYSPSVYRQFHETRRK